MRYLLAFLGPGIASFLTATLAYRMGHRRGKHDAIPGPYSWECLWPDCAFSCRSNDMEMVMRFADIHSEGCRR